MLTPSHSLTLIERVERALDLLARFVELDGDVYVRMYEKFETELEELKRHESVKDRALRRLANQKANSEPSASRHN
jgi:hypothetical protein